MKFALGLDVHKKETVYALVTDKGKTQERGSIKTDPKKCLELIEWIPKDQVIIGMESSTYIYPLYDILNDAGYTVKVANPMKLKRITQSLIKNDERDALEIALQLLRNDFPESYMLSKEMRDKRELVRQHIRLTQEKTRLKNQIHSHIAKHNFRVKSQMGTIKSFQELENMPLPKFARLTLNVLVSGLKSVQMQLYKLDNYFVSFVKNNIEATKLMTIDGIGKFTATTFIVELGDWHRFKSVQELTAYTGLIPCMKGSAKKMYYGRMRFDGNHQIKYAFNRAAEQAIRKDNKFKTYYNKLISRGKNRRTAIGAVANKLIRTSYGVLHNEELAIQALEERG